MTTDITELAQSLQRRATSAKEFGESLYVKADDALALVEALEHYKSREERVTNLVHDNSKSWNELYQQVEAKDKRNAELVEALEKAQQRIAELENYAEAEAVGADRAAEDGVYWMKRCKELESRAVTVKLTDINEYLADVHDKSLNRAFRLLAEGVRAGDVDAMRAAGIKVEAE
ncbi:RelE family toxin-antitoxin system [Klebsiella pneumoniae]|nr:RelE family toxin-antitoxin system [Klebsiella pneumoniae]